MRQVKEAIDQRDLIELKEMRASIDDLIECCLAGEIKKEEMISQIWLQFSLTVQNSQILH